jgi:hypothetical protein
VVVAVIPLLVEKGCREATRYLNAFVVFQFVVVVSCRSLSFCDSEAACAESLNAVYLFVVVVGRSRHCEWALCRPVAIQKLICLCLFRNGDPSPCLPSVRETILSRKGRGNNDNNKVEKDILNTPKLAKQVPPLFNQKGNYDHDKQQRGKRH